MMPPESRLASRIKSGTSFFGIDAISFDVMSSLEVVSFFDVMSLSMSCPSSTRQAPMSAGRATRTFCLSLCLAFCASQHAGAQRQVAFSIVQDVKTNTCKVAAGKETSTAEQTVLGEFRSLTEARVQLKQIPICKSREARLTSADRCWTETYGPRLQRPSDRRTGPSPACIPSQREVQRITQGGREPSKLTEIVRRLPRF